jgi:hypothetical protein
VRGFGMNWVRTHIRNGSTLALFALAIQMLLAFGHYHAGHAQAAPHGASIELTQLPSAPVHDQHAADHCDICAVISMAGTMLATSPPVLVLPLATDFRLVDARTQVIHRGASDIAFQPRAPPLS